jgi:hypothetical protein
VSGYLPDFEGFEPIRTKIRTFCPDRLRQAFAAALPNRCQDVIVEIWMHFERIHPMPGISINQLQSLVKRCHKSSSPVEICRFKTGEIVL